MRSEASRDLSLSVMALTGVLVLTALVAINLVERMTPKVERVLMENVYSAAAVHEMLAALASSSLPEPAARRPRAEAPPPAPVAIAASRGRPRRLRRVFVDMAVLGPPRGLSPWRSDPWHAGIESGR